MHLIAASAMGHRRTSRTSQILILPLSVRASLLYMLKSGDIKALGLGGQPIGLCPNRQLLIKGPVPASGRNGSGLGRGNNTRALRYCRASTARQERIHSPKNCRRGIGRAHAAPWCARQRTSVGAACWAFKGQFLLEYVHLLIIN